MSDTSVRRELPVDARAYCSDGEVGWVTDVVVDPGQRSITHLVVRVDDAAAREFLVPLQQVVESSRTQVRLGCTRAALQQLPEFTTRHYVPASSPEAQPVVAEWEMEGYSYYYGYEPIYYPAVAPDTPVPIDVHHVPAGELAFERGAPVESDDGIVVGGVQSFVVESATGEIRHFVVRLDHSGTPREVALPLSAVRNARFGTVRLSLTQQQLERLPSMPEGGRYSSTSDAPDALHIVSVVFDRPDQADNALQLAHQKLPKLDAAVVRKSSDGQLSMHEAHDITPRGGAIAGAVVGGVLSVIGGPVGVVAGGAIGGAVGGIVGRVVDRGIPDRYLRDLGRALHNGSSALVSLIAQRDEATLLETISPLQGTILRLELTDDMIARLTT